MSQKMGLRPSEVYFFNDQLTSYMFDKAVVTFGVALEADLDEYSKDETKTEAITRKRQERFSKWMNEKPKFRDPMKG